MIDGRLLTEVDHLPHRHARRQPHRQEFLNDVLPFERRLLFQNDDVVRVVAPDRGHECPSLERKDGRHVGVTIDRERARDLWVVLNLPIDVVI